MHLFYDLHTELTRFLFPRARSKKDSVPSPDLFEFNLSPNDRFVQFLNKQIPPAPVDFPSLIRLLNRDPKAISNAEKHLLGRYGAELGRFIKTKSTHPSLLEKEAKEIYKKILSAIQTCLYAPRNNSDQALLLRKIDQKIEQVNKSPWNNKDASIQKLNQLKEHIHAYSQSPDTSFGTEHITSTLAQHIRDQLETQKQQKLSTVNTSTLKAQIEHKYDYQRQFDIEEYKKILFYCSAAYLFEGNGIAHEHALKLTLIFGTARKAIEALNQFAKQNISTEGNNLDESQFVHQACLFTLPDTLPDIDDWERWKKLISEDLNDEPLLKSLTKANNIVHLYRAPEFRNKTMEPPPAKLKVEATSSALLQPIQQINHALKKRDLEREDKTKLTTHLNYLVKCHALQSALTKPPIPFKGLDKYAILGLYFHHIETADLSAKMLIESGLSDNAISTFYGLDKSQAGLNIPNVCIQCKDHPEYYFRKLNVVDDQKDAALAAILGKKTNCCQSLGDAGNDCAIHGLTSPNGGFYVLFKGDAKAPKPEDEVIAQSWAWRGKKGELVFDSTEYVDKTSDGKKVYGAFIKDVYHHLAQEITTKYPNITTLYIGSGGRTPSSIGAESFQNVKAVPTDYQGYNDSAKQRAIYDPDIPYLFLLKEFLIDNNYFKLKDKSTQRLKEVLDSNEPLNSNRFIQLLVPLLINEMSREFKSNILDVKDNSLKRCFHCDELNTTQKKKLEDYLQLNAQFAEFIDPDLDEAKLEKIIGLIQQGALLNLRREIKIPIRNHFDKIENQTVQATLFQAILSKPSLLFSVLKTLSNSDVLTVLKEPDTNVGRIKLPLSQTLMLHQPLKSILDLLSKEGQKEVLQMESIRRQSYFLYACDYNDIATLLELWTKEEILSFMQETKEHDLAFFSAARTAPKSLELLFYLYPSNQHLALMMNLTEKNSKGLTYNLLQMQFDEHPKPGALGAEKLLLLLPESDRLVAVKQRSYDGKYHNLLASLSHRGLFDHELMSYLSLFPKKDLKEVIQLFKDIPPDETIKDGILAVLNEQERLLDIEESTLDQSKFVRFSPTQTPSDENTKDQKPTGRPPSPGIL